MADASRQGEAPADAASVGRALPHVPWQTGAIQISQSTRTYVATPGELIRDTSCILCGKVLGAVPFSIITLIHSQPCEKGAINHIPTVTVAVHETCVIPADELLVDIVLASTAPCFGRMLEG